MKLTDEEFEQLALRVRKYRYFCEYNGPKIADAFLCGLRREIPEDWLSDAKNLFPEKFEYQEYLRLKEKYENKFDPYRWGYMNSPPLDTSLKCLYGILRERSGSQWL